MTDEQSKANVATRPHQEFWVVVPAAGVGARMLADQPKQYLPLAGKTVLEQTLSRLLEHPKVVGIVLVLGVDDLYWTESYLASDPRILIARGGAQRSHSVLNGLNRLAQIISTQEWVMVHD
ncbi:MAG: 2-C-methyl-D-erythritol 4-phosphate cytidylyltransferase, partial [Pseudomonadales bacterium]|nr:2-C-methyl-D-erythritol 4-phosphate cytidylyltransferase [Pseudomonadales bacterium]